MEHDLSFILNELGEERSHYFGAVAPPLIASVNFGFKTVAEMREAFADEYTHSLYSRGNNPTVTMLNEKMAALEKTEAALSFASGSAAIAAAVLNNVQQGDHIVCVRNPYSWTNKLLKLWLPRFGVTATMVDGTDAENYRGAIQPTTKMLYLESPNTFTFELQDVEAVVAIAKEHGLLTLMDNSYASPLNFQPATLGVDLVMHAATKYIGGHSDALAGIVCGSEKALKQIFHSEYMTLGGVLSSFNAWLLLRGLRTLDLRMERVAKNGLVLAEFLERHPKVDRVHYPFLPSHPQHALAKQQMKRGAGQFSIELATKNSHHVENFCEKLERFTLAASWGGYESLVWPFCAVPIVSGKPPIYPVNLIRFYAGLEDSSVLIEDLEQALEDF